MPEPDPPSSPPEVADGGAPAGDAPGPPASPPPSTPEAPGGWWFGFGPDRFLPATGRAVAGLDYAATALFALEGATLGALARLDLFGVLVIGVVSAVGGGTIRDVLLGDIPPFSVRTSRYVLLALAGGLAAFVFNRHVEAVDDWALIALDAAGLALFAVAGATKAYDFRVPLLSCCFLGTLTAVGGGVLRDLLLDRVPIILFADVYATAAFVGATATVACLRFGVRRPLAIGLGAAACFGLRMAAAWGEWSLPTAF